MTVPFDPDQYDRMSSASVPGYAALQELVAVAAAAMAPVSSCRVLDLGCGTGTGTLALSRALPAAQLSACDPAAAMVAAARSRCESAGTSVHFVVGGLGAVPDDAPFDVIVCTLVLHFLPVEERAVFLTSIRERLRPGGTLILSVLGRADDADTQAVWSQIRRRYATSRGIAPAELAAREASTRGKVHPLSFEEARAALHGAGFTTAVPVFQLVGVHSWLARLATPEPAES